MTKPGTDFASWLLRLAGILAAIALSALVLLLIGASPLDAFALILSGAFGSSAKLAYVMTGGELSTPAWVDEQYLLDLEREAFLSLAGEKKTQERMWNILQTGKPLRN